MIENKMNDFIKGFVHNGPDSTVPSDVSEALACSSLEVLSLRDFRKREDVRSEAVKCLMDYLAPSIDSFDRIQRQSEELGTPINEEFLNNLSNRGFCGDFQALDRKFENPFPETLRYRMFQGSLAECLTGMYPVEDLMPYCTPTLPYSALISQMEVIQQECFDTGKRLYDIRECLGALPIFLVTKELEGREHRVTNPFDGNEAIKKVPKSMDMHEGGSDALGMYVPSVGAIYLWVDKIYSYRAYPLIFQKVLLHELIHFLFDVVRRSSSDESAGTKKGSEEKLDNLLVLFLYANSISPIQGGREKGLADIRDFISQQPAEYRDAIEEFEKVSDWFSIREQLYNFLK